MRVDAPKNENVKPQPRGKPDVKRHVRGKEPPYGKQGELLLWPGKEKQPDEPHGGDLRREKTPREEGAQ